MLSAIIGVVPDFVPPDRVWFDVLPSGLASLVVYLDTDAVRRLPLPTRDAAAAEAAVTLEDWRLMARTTMTVVDGPGDLGFVVGGRPDLAAWVAWVDASVSHGGAIVFFTPAPEEHTHDEVRVRGGFIRNTRRAEYCAERAVLACA
jgi:hypothetical protein